MPQICSDDQYILMDIMSLLIVYQTLRFSELKQINSYTTRSSWIVLSLYSTLR